jgi:allantoate deiminase
VPEIVSASVDALIERMAVHGPDPRGGMARVVYTPEWRAAVDELDGWCREAGFETRLDAAGNLIARAGGEGPAIATGSHIDTAVQGGRYDGTAGVVCGFLALAALLEEHGTPRRPVELIAFCDEESSRFPSSFWGSRALAGGIAPHEAAAITEAQGTTIAEAMRECGFDPDALASAARDDIDVFLELHVEQGPVLEQAGAPVGLVTAISGMYWAEHEYTGFSAHAGGAPRAMRRDTVQGAAEATLAVDRIVAELGEPARGTVGRITAFPGAPNIVPGRATFSTDLRHPEGKSHRLLIERVQTACAEIAERRGLGHSSEVMLEKPPTPMDPELVELLESAARELGLAAMRLHSGGGHDAMILAAHGVRTAMLFVPSRDGISHAPEEFTSADELAAGTAVLARALHTLAWKEN